MSEVVQLQKGDRSSSTASIPDHDVVITQLRAHMQALGKSQNEVATATGTSTAMLSQFLAKKYPNMAGATETYWGYLQLERRRAISPKKPDFVMTSIATDIFGALSYVELNRSIGLIVGKSGIGKTVALEEYANANRQKTIMIKAHARSEKALLDKLTYTITGKRTKETNADMTDRLIRNLTGSNRILIIDEAQRLSPNALEAVRAISDEAGIGVVLSGTPELLERLDGEGFEHIRNRASITKRYENIRGADDIELVFQESALEPDAINFLYKIARSKSSLRGAVHLYVYAANFCLANGRELTASILQELNEYQTKVGWER